MEGFTIEELEKVLSDGDFDSLIGKIENDFFDCKNQIYNLKDEYSKLELAKDVSSFANLNGGYILIGPKTKNSKTHFGDEITEISLLDQNLVNPNQYKNVIKEWIYPNEIQGIRVYWKASKIDSKKGILVIEIPPQKESLKPFLISKIVGAGRKISETIFGYAERKGDRSEPKRIKDIYKIMRDGLFYDKNIENRFNNLESIMQPFLKKRQEEEQRSKSRDITNKRVNEILKLYGDNKRIIILIAYPKEKSGELKSLFTNEEGSIKRKLEDPPLNSGKIRYAGWSLETLDRGKIIEGQFVRVQNGDRKIIDLYNDGTLIFTGLADERFLAHASQDGLRINSIALIELVYNFISFYREVINDLTIKPDMISVEFRFANMHLGGEKSYLREGKIGTWGKEHEAPQDTYSLETPIDFNVKNFDEGKIAEIAYKVIEKIYLWFGIPLDRGNIPYTKTENSVVSIDIEQIRKK